MDEHDSDIDWSLLEPAAHAAAQSWPLLDGQLQTGCYSAA
jgi:hypothetical protein